MANYATLKAAIQQVVKTNGNNEITGALLQQSLLAMITSLGANYQFVGIAGTTTNPGTPDQNVFYLAGPGTYANFNGLVVPDGYLGALKYNGSWSVQTVAVGKDYTKELANLDSNKVSISTGKNIYDNILESGYFLANGNIEPSSVNYHTKNYMRVSPNTQYHFSRTGNNIICYGTFAYGIWYDENFGFISSFLAETQTVTSPSNAAYLRTSVRLAYNDNVQIETGNTRTEYESYNPIAGYLSNLPVGLVKLINIDPQDIDTLPSHGSNKLVRSGGVIAYNDRTNVKIGCKNIFDGVLSPGYMNPNGTIDASTVNYYTPNYLPVYPNTHYHISRSGDQYVAIGNVSLCFYDYAKNFISSTVIGGVKNFTTPENCCYIRTTIRLAYNVNVQIEQGDERTEYVAYNPIHDYLTDFYNVIKGFDVAESLAGKDANIVTAVAVEANTTLTLPNFPTMLKKRLCISFGAKFTQFSKIAIGQNYKQYDGAGIEIDDTNVYLVDYSANSQSIRHTVAHNIASFSTFISVSLFIDAAQRAYITLSTLGAFVQLKINDYNYAHSGVVFARSETAISDIKLTATCSDFRCPVWAFGDSYFGLSVVRVGYWLRKIGFFNILFNGLGGQTATGSMDDLQKCLNFGTPKFIVWALGMNGAPDSNGQPNSTWLQITNQLIEICEQKGITPILCTIPTVPGIVHDALSAWVRNSGKRYIDVAAAVGSQPNGTWYDNMLSSDNVHPTEYGAQIIAQRWLVDFPEIMQYGIVDPDGETNLITI